MVVWVDGESDYAEGKERTVKRFLDLTVFYTADIGEE